MRDIKFRAWDRRKNEMYEVKALGWYSDAFTINDIPSLQTEHADERNVRSRYLTTDYRDADLMQYTGLKDKNGKEIYEGDIIDGKLITEFGSLAPDVPGVVIWNVSTAGFAVDEVSGSNQIYYIGRFVQVLGNIHENPELISKRTDQLANETNKHTADTEKE